MPKSATHQPLLGLNPNATRLLTTSLFELAFWIKMHDCSCLSGLPLLQSGCFPETSVRVTSQNRRWFSKPRFLQPFFRNDSYLPFLSGRK